MVCGRVTMLWYREEKRGEECVCIGEVVWLAVVK